MKILSFGEIVFDIHGDNVSLGGAPLNFCAHARRAGAQAYLLSAVGNDTLGTLAREKIRHHGIAADYVYMLAGRPTGTCRVALDTHGTPTYTLARHTAYDAIPLPEELPEEWDALCFGTLALREEQNREVIKALLRRTACREIFVDVNIRPPFYSVESILIGLQNATILKVSDEELPLIMLTLYGDTPNPDEAIDRLATAHPNIRLFLLTCGERGSVAYDVKNGKIHRCEAVKTNVVSTVGAGDCFSATFLVGHLNDTPIEEALRQASLASAYVVSQEGAIPEE